MLISHAILFQTEIYCKIWVNYTLKKPLKLSFIDKICQI
jgi:hypothetical protein